MASELPAAGRKRYAYAVLALNQQLSAFCGT
jgi:hypothetical protein